MKDPKIYLVLDNCFAIKRWVKPSIWMQVGSDLGIKYMQASTYNEIDPLFSSEQYMNSWAEEAKKAEEKHGIKIVNFYTGYQTYRTIGLAHQNETNKSKLINSWFHRMIDFSSQFKAGLGFFMFALTEEVLQNSEKYKITSQTFFNNMSEIASYAKQKNVQISFEQMYTPHQPPWTINQSLDYLRNIYKIAQSPSYITIDVGHQVGQNKFRKPDKSTIENIVIKKLNSQNLTNIWLGPDTNYEIVTNSSLTANQKIKLIIENIEKYSYLFAEEIDSDVYKWFELTGKYSPIVHLQQHDGTHSAHDAFTSEKNVKGIIKPDKLLKSLNKSYLSPVEKGLPPVAENIYLSFEIFGSTSETSRNILNKIKESIEYWRKYIPQDGMKLSEIVGRL